MILYARDSLEQEVKFLSTLRHVVSIMVAISLRICSLNWNKYQEIVEHLYIMDLSYSDLGLSIVDQDDVFNVNHSFHKFTRLRRKLKLLFGTPSTKYAFHICSQKRMKMEGRFVNCDFSYFFFMIINQVY